MANASIFSQYLKPVKSVAEYGNEMDAAEQNQLQLAANRLGLQDDQAMRQASMQAGGDQNKLLQLLQSGGQYKGAQALQKSMLDTQKTRADVDKTQAEVIDKTLGTFRSYVPQVGTPEQAGQYAAAMYDHPVLGKLASQFGSREDVIKRNIEAFAKDPRAWMVNTAGVTADKLLESMKGLRQNVSLGGTSQGSTVNYYGEVVPGQTTNTPITQSADNVASNATSRANNAASVGASYANANATRAVAASNVTAAGMRRDQDTEMKLADDYRAQSKGFKEVGDAYKQISSVLDKSTTSAAATLAGATKFMKLLDPGSVVRESELGMALAASGVLDRATNYVNTLRYGKVLTPSQAKDFKKITQDIYGAAQAGQKQIDANYKRQAETYKLRPEMIIQDLGQNTPAASPAGAAKFLGFE